MLMANLVLNFKILTRYKHLHYNIKIININSLRYNYVFYYHNFKLIND
jgi:hypothetical protein